MTQRRSPSSRSISGSQPRIWRARVMSGRRICGSSIGSASNTISLVEPVTRMHGLRELEHRHLVIGVADVDRQVLVARREQVEPADQVVDVAERPRLRAVAEDGERLALERLVEELDGRAAVVRPMRGP